VNKNKIRLNKTRL